MEIQILFLFQSTNRDVNAFYIWSKCYEKAHKGVWHPPPLCLKVESTKGLTCSLAQLDMLLHQTEWSLAKLQSLSVLGPAWLFARTASWGSPTPGQIPLSTDTQQNSLPLPGWTSPTRRDLLSPPGWKVPKVKCLTLSCTLKPIHTRDKLIPPQIEQTIWCEFIHKNQYSGSWTNWGANWNLGVDTPIGNSALVQFVDKFINSFGQFVRQFVSGVNRPLPPTACTGRPMHVVRRLRSRGPSPGHVAPTTLG